LQSSVRHTVVLGCLKVHTHARCILAWVKVHSSTSQSSSQQCMQKTQRRAHCSLYNTCWIN